MSTQTDARRLLEDIQKALASILNQVERLEELVDEAYEEGVEDGKEGEVT